MTKAFRALMNEAIDYAGLFPPAKLDLQTALNKYFRHRKSRESWMLGRFILPARMLPEFQAEMAKRPAPPEMIRLTLLAGSGDHEETAFAVARRKAAATREFLTTADWAAVESLETRIPKETIGLVDRAEGTREFVRRFLESWEGLPPFRAPACFEVETTPQDEYADLPIATGLKGARDDGFNVALKLRCGGPTPEELPPVFRVADIIRMCSSSSVPLKLTAGLHHALRSGKPTPAELERAAHHVRPMPWIPHHGFLNVMCAGVLGLEFHVDSGGLRECLLDSEPGHFRFTDDAFSWGGLSFDTAHIENTRARLIPGFGSCSFDEPVEELRSLGLLD